MRLAWTFVIACAVGCSERGADPSIEAVVVEVKPVADPPAPPAQAAAPLPQQTAATPPAAVPTPEPPKPSSPRHPPTIHRAPPLPAHSTGSAASPQSPPLSDFEQNPYVSK